jgi:hypothetical protein
MTALVLRATRLDVDQGPFLVPFLVPRYRNIKPNTQYYESERFFSLSKWMQKRKKQRRVVSLTISSSFPWHFSQLAMLFFTIEKHQLSQLTMFFFRN